MRIRIGPYHHLVTVLALSERTRAASVAATCTEEEECRKARETLQVQ